VVVFKEEAKEDGRGLSAAVSWPERHIWLVWLFVDPRPAHGPGEYPDGHLLAASADVGRARRSELLEPGAGRAGRVRL
jgi:hypothetical protein